MREADPPVSAVIINCEMIHDMDTAAADELLRLYDNITAKGVGIYIARAHAKVRGFMERDGIVERIGAENFFPKVGDAVEAFILRAAEGGHPGAGEMDERARS